MGEAQVEIRGRRLLALWVLVALFVAAAVVGGATALAARDVPPPEAFAEFNGPRVDQLQRAIESGATGIVVLGDSRTRYAVDADALAADLADSTTTEVQVLRVVNNFADFEDFEPLLDAIIAARPAVVLIQEDLTTKERAPLPSLVEGQRFVLWELFGDGPWHGGDEDQAGVQFEDSCDTLGSGFAWVSLGYEPDGRSARIGAEFVAELNERGSRVEYFRIPTNGDVTRLQFEPDPSLGSLVLDPTIDPDSFCDAVHMDPDGRERYTDWLSDVLTAMLREGQ